MTWALLTLPFLGCSGSAPEGEPIQWPVVPVDEDGDGYPVEQDCDDADAGVHLGVPDPAGDGLDLDCDGSDASSALASDLVGLAFPAAQRNEEFGQTLASADVDGDGRDEVFVGTEQINGPGLVWPVMGPTLEPADPLYGSAIGKSWVGSRLAVADLDGVPGPDIAASHLLGVVVIPGNPLPVEMSDPRVLYVEHGLDVKYSLGHLAAGDLGGDGVADLATSCTDAGGQRSRLCILAGPLAPKTYLDDATTIVDIGVTGGMDSAIGDVDGDGLADLVIGDWGYESDTGRLLLLPGPLAEGFVFDDTVTSTVVGDAPGDWLGQEAQRVGDLDGDGQEDLLVTALGWPGGDRRGQVRDYQWGAGGLEAGDLAVDGEGDWQQLGRAIATGDYDGDGQEDLALGPYDPTFTLPGRMVVFYGPVSGHLSAVDADRAWAGEARGDAFGASLVSADVDGDGVDDLVMGAPGNDESAENAGKVYLLLGGVDL